MGEGVRGSASSRSRQREEAEAEAGHILPRGSTWRSKARSRGIALQHVPYATAHRWHKNISPLSDATTFLLLHLALLHYLPLSTSLSLSRARDSTHPLLVSPGMDMPAMLPHASLQSCQEYIHVIRQSLMHEQHARWDASGQAHTAAPQMGSMLHSVWFTVQASVLTQDSCAQEQSKASPPAVRKQSTLYTCDKARRAHRIRFANVGRVVAHHEGDGRAGDRHKGEGGPQHAHQACTYNQSRQRGVHMQLRARTVSCRQRHTLHVVVAHS